MNSLSFLHFSIVTTILAFTLIGHSTEKESTESDNKTPIQKTKPAQEQARQKKSKKKSISVSKSFRVNYGANGWNQDPKAIDSAFAFIKDKHSGKTVKVILDETEPDSSTFTGQFTVNWGDSKAISPEVYIPPKKLKGDQEGQSNFHKMLREGEIKRKPLLFKKSSDGEQILDVYDTKEQVLQAIAQFRKEKQLKRDLKEQKRAEDLAQTLATKRNLEAQRLAKKMALIEKVKAAALQQEKERLRKKQI